MVEAGLTHDDPGEGLFIVHRLFKLLGREDVDVEGMKNPEEQAVNGLRGERPRLGRVAYDKQVQVACVMGGANGVGAECSHHQRRVGGGNALRNA